MTSLLRAAAVCLAVFGLVVVTGCGGSSGSTDANAYVKSINQINTGLEHQIESAGSGPVGSDPVADAKKTFSGFDAAIQNAITKLNGLTPPDKVKGLHSQFISQLTAFDQRVQAAVGALKSKQPETVLKASQTFETSVETLGKKLEATITAINAQLHH
jgi:hypothetical protein